jgi:uncharacterized protein (TIGR02145 family)
MKKKLFLLKSAMLILITLSLYNCTKKDQTSDSPDSTKVPVVTTSEVTNITNTGATCGGNITNDNGNTIIARGVCWSTGNTPTVSDNKTSDGQGAGSFTSLITGLNANTTYFIRAYATNSKGTGYGSAVTSTTKVADAVDYEGNKYKTVTIGNQVWMAENLKSTKYNDGTSIPLVEDKSSWSALSTDAYSWCNNDNMFISPYGGFYNWYAVNTGKLAPKGWHVPTKAEWTILINYLGGAEVAGSKLKETGVTHWNSPNTDATNTSGFTALPGGRRAEDGYFYDLYFAGEYWTSSESGSSNATIESMLKDNGGVTSIDFSKKCGMPVRCIKD